MSSHKNIKDPNSLLKAENFNLLLLEQMEQIIIFIKVLIELIIII